MKKLKVRLDFAKFLVVDKITFYLNAITKLTSNPYFTTPDVALSELSLAVANMQAAMIAAEDGGYTAKSHLRDLTEIADQLFIRTARYIDRTADGDETKILSSGFHETKQPAAHNKPPLEVLDGDHIGQLKFKAKQHPKGRACIWQVFKGDTLPADAVWVTIATTTTATFIHDGFESGCYYFFRMAIVTPDGTTDYCEPVKKFVL